MTSSRDLRRHAARRIATRRAGLVLVAILAAACERPERELSRARTAESRRVVEAVLADADRLEARLVLARTLPGECRDALRSARSRQRGAVMFVRGDHCWVVRELSAPRGRR